MEIVLPRVGLVYYGRGCLQPFKYSPTVARKLLVSKETPVLRPVEGQVQYVAF